MIYNLSKLRVWVKEARYRDLSFHSNRKQLLNRLSKAEDEKGSVDVDDEVIDSMLSILMSKNSDINNDVRLNYVHLVSTIYREVHDAQINEVFEVMQHSDDEQEDNPPDQPQPQPQPVQQQPVIQQPVNQQQPVQQLPPAPQQPL